MISNRILRRFVFCGIIGSGFSVAMSVLPPKSAFCSSVTWNVDSDGLWHVPSNWSSNPSLPGLSDDVIIDREGVSPTVEHSQGADTINSLMCNENLIISGGSLTVTNSTQINSCFTISGGTAFLNGITALNGETTLNGGTIAGGGVVSIGSGAVLNWTCGIMTGSGSTQIAPGAIMNIGSSASQNIYLARTINNTGEITLSGGMPLCNYTGGTPTINNLAGAVFDLQNDQGINRIYAIDSVVNNAGTFQKSGGSGTSSINWTFNNTGTLKVLSGTLSISSAFYNTGTANVQAGSTLNLSGGGTSAATYNVALGAVLNFSNGTHDLSGSTFFNTGTINFSGGTENFDAPTTLPGTVSISGGTISGGGAVNIGSGATLNWTCGKMAGSGSTEIAPGAIMNIGSSASQNIYLARTINNTGEITLSGGMPLCNYTGGTPTINNLAGAVFDLQNDQGINRIYAIDSVVNNAGTFQKSGGSGTSSINWTFNNTGTLKVLSGTLMLQNSVTQVAGNTLTGGTWIVQTDSSLEMTMGNSVYTNQGNVTLDGNGSIFSKIDTLQDNQGSFSVLNGRDFTTAGNLANSGLLTVGAGSNFDVNGGISGTGNTIVDGGTLTTDFLMQNTITLGPGATVTIRAVPGGPSAMGGRLSPVPEPATITALLLAGAGLGFWGLAAQRLSNSKSGMEESEENRLLGTCSSHEITSC